MTIPANVSRGALAAPARRQGNYAGAATRLTAFAIDLGAIWGIGVVVIALVSETARLVAGYHVSLSNKPVLNAVLGVVWAFVYFSYQWSLSGRTIGMAIIGLQVVARDGSRAGARRAVVRTITLPLSFLLLGLGFIGILVHRERLALHDRLAGTAVVYSWDARAARLRWLARTHELSEHRPPERGTASRTTGGTPGG